MGYSLRREIRDLLPRGGVLTPSEWRLILELADWCNDKTRSGKPGAERLAGFTDMSDPGKVGEMFASIAKKWVELRVPLGLGKDGRPYYSRPRANTEYHFPETEKLSALVKAPSNEGPSEVPESGGPKVPESGGAEAPQFGLEEPIRSPDLGEQSPQGSSPQNLPSSLSPRGPDTSPVGAAPKRERDPDSERSTTQEHPPPGDHSTERAVLAKHNCTGDQADRVIAHYAALGKGPGWFKTVDKAGDMPARIKDAEDLPASDDEKATRGRFLQEIGWEPQCEHGVHGGHIQQPGVGWVHCAMERKRLEQVAAPRSNRLRGHTTRPDGPDSHHPVYDDPEMMKFK